MKCPFCRENTTDVFNTRSTRFGTQIWRRRKCLSCHESFTTYEAPDPSFLKVAKKNGKKQPYSRAKLYSSIYPAFLSISAKESATEGLTDTIEAKVLDLRQREVTSREIAEIVLATLKNFNTTAFVRYLSEQTDLISNAQLKRELKKY